MKNFQFALITENKFSMYLVVGGTKTKLWMAKVGAAAAMLNHSEIN